MPLFSVAPVRINDETLPTLNPLHIHGVSRPEAYDNVTYQWSFLDAFKSNIDLVQGAEFTPVGESIIAPNYATSNSSARGVELPIIEARNPVETISIVFKPTSGSLSILYGTLHSSATGIGYASYLSERRTVGEDDVMKLLVNNRGSYHQTQFSGAGGFPGYVYVNEWNHLIVSRYFKDGLERLSYMLNGGVYLSYEEARDNYISAKVNFGIGDLYYAASTSNDFDYAEFTYSDSELNEAQMRELYAASKMQCAKYGINFRVPT